MSYGNWFVTGVTECSGRFIARYDGEFVGEYATRKAAKRALNRYARK